MKFNFGKKVLAVTLAALTILTTGISSLPTTVHAEEGTGESASVVTNDTYSQFGKHSGHYVFSTGGAQYTAFCLHPDKESPGKHDTFNSIGYSDNQMLRKVMYFGATGPADIVTSFYGGDAQKAYLATHYLASAANAGAATIDDSPYKGYYGDLNNVRNLYNSIAAQASPPEEFKVTLWALKGNPNKQTLSTFKTVAKPDTYLTMTKTSALPEISDGNSCYSLAGAEYTVYTDGGCTSPAKDVNGNTAVLTTDANGNANTIHFNFEGTVYVKETKAPQGYEMDSNVHSVALTKDTTATFTASDQPGNDPVNLFLSKKDAETGENSPAGGAKLEGAEYTVRYYDTISTSDPAASGATPKRTWVFRTNKNGYFSLSDSYKVSGDALYQQHGNYVLPLGTVTFTETKAPEGYQLNPTVYVANTSMDPASRAVRTTNLPTEATAAKEQVYRGDFRIRKIEASSGRTLANIPFRITSVETGEYHAIMTDENGVYDSSSTFVKHSQDTNGGKATSGLWFTGESTGTKAPVDDSLGALPYGTYKIEELPCKENEKYVPFNDTFTVSRDGYTVDFNTIPNWDKPEIASDATGDLGNSHFAMTDTGMSINDRVSYDNISENALKYYGVNGTSNLTMVSKIYDKTTGAFLKKADGSDLSFSKTFEAKRQSGSISMMLTADSTNLAGHTLVIYEYLYGKSADGTDILLAKEEDPNEESQMIFIPKIETNATEKTIGDHFLKAGSDATVNDTITYTNLPENKTFFIDGKLVDSDTGETVTDANGQPVVNTLKVTTDAQNGIFTNTFHFQVPTEWEGRSFVICETVRDRGNMVYTSEEDLKNADQTLHVVKVRTTASDGQTKDHVGALTKTATIVDAVKFWNLIPGKTYTITGTLQNKSTGKALKDANGKAITATKTFVADKADGTMDLTFTLDSSILEGKTVVAFESISVNKQEIGTHKDLNDEDQTVHYPKVRTKAIDEYTGDHVGTLFGKVETALRNMLHIESKDKQSIVDTVSLENLVVGQKYNISGVLMDKKTGEAAKDENGNPIVGTSGEFTATATNMTKGITYKVDASNYENTTFVVFETLSHNGIDVAKHNDLSDEDQSIYNMESHTTYVSGETKDHVGVVSDSDTKTTTVDTVAVKKLRAGETYTITGTLHVKETGEELKDANGKAVTATKTFVAGDTSAMTVSSQNGNSVSGSIDLTFTYDSSALSGKTVVAFETVDHNGKTIYVHADLNDENQSVHYPNLSTKALNDATKDQSGSLGTMKLSDTISMKNLIPGQKYTVTGIVMDKDTGKAVSLEGTKTFTAKKSQENIVFSFTVKNDGSLEGHTLVLVDHLYHNDVLIKNHADLTDKDQSIYIPKIRTTAVDGKSGTHSGIIGSTTLVDTITYENLIPGKEYTVFGSLMNAKTGEKMIDLAGNYMEAKKTFTASERNGKVTLSFAIDSRLLKDVTVVAFEDLYHENVKVAVHADLTDKDQSVHYPGMGTSATVNGSHYAPTAKKTKLVDRVWYQNLVPGHTYRVEGTLMDKATGKPILINGGEVTVKKDFVPKSANGYVDMEFEFNSSSLDKHTVVVFEHMYDGKVLLTSHADINDSAQSVRFDNAPAKGLSPKTGDPTNPFLPAVPFGAASIMLIVLVLLKKKKNVTR